MTDAYLLQAMMLNRLTGLAQEGVIGMIKRHGIQSPDFTPASGFVPGV